MKILIAEDDAKLLKSLLHVFERNRFQADGVTNGADALAYAQTDHYDGLVLDIMMPEMNGLDVLRQLRSKGINTPAMFLSARTEVYQRVEGLDAGADDYLPKPFPRRSCLPASVQCSAERIHFRPICCNAVICCSTARPLSFPAAMRCSL